MTTGQTQKLESLIIRGLPPRYVASQLGVPNELAEHVAAEAVNRGALSEYHRACIERAANDAARHDAAIYLYVRNVPIPLIRQACGLPENYKFDARKKLAYQDKQLELALQSI